MKKKEEERYSIEPNISVSAGDIFNDFLLWGHLMFLFVINLVSFHVLTPGQQTNFEILPVTAKNITNLIL